MMIVLRLFEIAAPVPAAFDKFLHNRIFCAECLYEPEFDGVLVVDLGFALDIFGDGLDRVFGSRSGMLCYKMASTVTFA